LKEKQEREIKEKSQHAGNDFIFLFAKVEVTARFDLTRFAK